MRLNKGPSHVDYSDTGYFPRYYSDKNLKLDKWTDRLYKLDRRMDRREDRPYKPTQTVLEMRLNKDASHVDYSDTSYFPRWSSDKNLELLLFYSLKSFWAISFEIMEEQMENCTNPLQVVIFSPVLLPFLSTAK